jgi:hypothetical protein
MTLTRVFLFLDLVLLSKAAIRQPFFMLCLFISVCFGPFSLVFLWPFIFGGLGSNIVSGNSR